MKIIFSSISRLFFSYSKFFASLALLSGISSFAYAADQPTYLKCNERYYKLTGLEMRSSYNVRTKKFKYSYQILSYTNDYIKLNYIGMYVGWTINRNTGEFKTLKDKVACIMNKISFKDLPKLNDHGKLF
tara:strand:+ start:84 stop:473 length:390 start_codon:yes stop_codon:yes gene_type:complete